MIDQETLKELIHYCPTSGKFTWKIRSRKWFKTERSCQSWNNRYACMRAGSVRKKASGYEREAIGIFNKLYLSHKLAWLYMTGIFPDFEIDHKNRNALDNRWDNLQQSDGFKNHQNMSMFKNNKSGVCGVYFDKRIGRWVADVFAKGVKHRLGTYSVEHLDIAAMDVMEKRISLGFNPNHGLAKAHYHK